MKRMIVVIITCLLVGFSPFGASAHDGGHSQDVRIWKDADGLFEIEGSFVAARDNQVQILKHDGPAVWVPLDKLSEADRTWVQKRVGAIRRLNGENPDAVNVTVPTDTPDASHREWTNAAVSVGGLMVFAVIAVAMMRASRAHRGVTVAAVLLVTGTAGILAIAPDAPPKSAIQTHFEPFKDKLKFRSDDQWFYVESNGLPDHSMMVGITSWQQQVPLAQNYTGRNAWQIPLVPKLSEKPISTKTHLYRGAIALAVNGVPIFNALNNRGDDAYKAGELDEYGGHCGRADDYHYHIAPVHLEKVAGKGKPIGYALDGFPLFGYTDADGKEPKDLDEFNGRTEKDGYRYYSTKTYPYINGGLRGIVTVKDDQVDPQPRAYSPRPALTPLRGAKITGFERDDAKKSATLKYEQGGKTGSVKYTATVDGYQFEFTEPGGKLTTETYRVPEEGKRPPPKKDGPPKKDDRPPSKNAPEVKVKDGFTLASPAFEKNGKMPAEFTGDGEGVSPPLRWSGAPAGTKFYALQLWHKPKSDGDEVKSYWVVSSIPTTVTSLDKNSKSVGKDGVNDKHRTGYDPMNSKGPGPKEYHITLYALSAEPKFDNDKFARADLLKAIKGITLAESTLSYTYERKSKP